MTGVTDPVAGSTTARESRPKQRDTIQTSSSTRATSTGQYAGDRAILVTANVLASIDVIDAASPCATRTAVPSAFIVIARGEAMASSATGLALRSLTWTRPRPRSS